MSKKCDGQKTFFRRDSWKMLGAAIKNIRASIFHIFHADTRDLRTNKNEIYCLKKSINKVPIFSKQINLYKFVKI